MTFAGKALRQVLIKVVGLVGHFFGSQQPLPKGPICSNKRITSGYALKGNSHRNHQSRKLLIRTFVCSGNSKAILKQRGRLAWSLLHAP